jgi:hypothetical protein
MCYRQSVMKGNAIHKRKERYKPQPDLPFSLGWRQIVPTFLWKIPDDGYDWHELPPGGDYELVPRLVSELLDPGAHFEQLNDEDRQLIARDTRWPDREGPSSVMPLRFAPVAPDGVYYPRRDLFLEFAALRCEQLAIQEFAWWHGSLGLVAGETFSAWCAEIEEMAAAVKLHNEKNMRELQLLVNRRLDSLVKVELALIRNRTADFPLTLRPRSLLGHMWLCFGTLSDSEWERRDCLSCNAPMAVVVAGRRDTRKTCSDACKMRRSRLRLRKKRKKSMSPLTDPFH